MSDFSYAGITRIKLKGFVLSPGIALRNAGAPLNDCKITKNVDSYITFSAFFMNIERADQRTGMSTGVSLPFFR